MENTRTAVSCSHCGEACVTEKITLGDKLFCCEGCRMVYELLDRNGLCNYYQLNEQPGVSRRSTVRKDKFAFLDEEKMAAGLVSFQNEEEMHVRFYLPAIHCSSCLYLLENLHRLHAGIVSSRIDFAAREIALVLDRRRISLRETAELLSSVGYEPYVSLRDLQGDRPGPDRGLIYRLGVAGFCFGNIMLLSFPEYLGLDTSEALLRQAFRYLGLVLALPVLFYSAQPFFSSAWKGLRGRFLNIDAPIALAVLVTFVRSAWEVVNGTGSGFFDSMSGIVFFMLAGRVLQDRTYRQLSFDRDYTAYFPMAVTVLEEGGREMAKSLPELRCDDTLLIHNGELIPADGLLVRGKASIDYSFVTGESLPVSKDMGEIVYAGGRQTGAAIEVLVIKEVAQSYLTQLWNRQPSRPDGEKGRPSFVDTLSRYFTVAVLGIALAAGVYWQWHDPAKTWGAVTAVLIVACPCALLLSSTFTNGNLLRVLARHHFYLRNATVIESIAAITHIVFDKTGTLTDSSIPAIRWEGVALSASARRAVATLARQSTHPLSRALAAHLRSDVRQLPISNFIERPGQGLDALIGGRRWIYGSREFVRTQCPAAAADFHTDETGIDGSVIYIACDNRLLGAYHFSSHYREGIGRLARRLHPRHRLSVLSGDSRREQGRLRQLLGERVHLLFGRSPREKTKYIRLLQDKGEKVMMVGDGLNDAGALQQSDVGIAVTADCSLFTPASDAILRADQLVRLPAFIRFCRCGRRVIVASFILSTLYNMIGLYFAVHGVLSPLVAAVLMPASSLSILLVTYGSSNVLARLLLPDRMEGPDGESVGDRPDDWDGEMDQGPGAEEDQPLR